MDTLAAKAKADPLAFRLRHLTDKRVIGVLQAAAERFGWVAGPAPSGRGVGRRLRLLARHHRRRHGRGAPWTAQPARCG